MSELQQGGNAGAAAPRPVELRVSKDRRLMSVRFDDGRTCQLPAEWLRVFSPSAEVQGHSPDQRKLVAGKREVAIRELVPTGHYAVRIVFDDGHDTGIFTWSYLHDMGLNGTQRFAAYEAELAEKGLTRDRR
jgi:DUF971 family protein